MTRQNDRYKNVATLTADDIADLTIFSDSIEALANSVATVSDTIPVKIETLDWQPVSDKTTYVAYCSKEIKISKNLNTPPPKLVMIAPHMVDINETSAISIDNQIESILVNQSTVRRCGIRLLSYTQPPHESTEPSPSNRCWMTKMYFVAEYDIPTVSIDIDVQVIG